MHRLHQAKFLPKALHWKELLVPFKPQGHHASLALGIPGGPRVLSCPFCRGWCLTSGSLAPRDSCTNKFVPVPRPQGSVGRSDPEDCLLSSDDVPSIHVGLGTKGKAPEVNMESLLFQTLHVQGTTLGCFGAL